MSAQERIDEKIVPNDPEIRQFAWYVRNCLESSATRLERILLEQLEVLAPRGEAEAHSPPFDAGRSLADLRHVLRGCTAPLASGDQFEDSVAYAREQFRLDEVETQILLLLFRYERNSYLQRFADLVAQRFRNAARAVAALLAESSRVVRDRLGPNSTLISSGLLIDDEDDSSYRDFSGSSGRLRVSSPIRRAMNRPCQSREEWCTAIVGAPVSTVLAWDDFAYVGRPRDLAAKMLAGALHDRSKAINVLIHGPVGVGKTELCKAIAQRLGSSIWSVGELDQEGGEPTRCERLAALRLSGRLLSSRLNSVILFDEAEDVLIGPEAGMGDREQSKVFVNRLLETNVVPVLWTCNRTDSIDPAYIRRMTLVVEVKVPPLSVRERIWSKIASDAKIDLSPAAISRLAGEFQAPVGVIAGAVRAAHLARGAESEVEDAMAAMLRLLGMARGQSVFAHDQFDLTLVSCRDDLSGLVDRLARPGVSQSWSLCIHGPPGTGKTQFVRYLAHRLGKELTQKRASDLLSPFVGMTERRIAQAFADARADGTMLFIDEADSLFQDRRYAHYSWEVTQVNEMLTWIDQHPLPVVCTTNLVEFLDPATLRRFTFKLRFDLMMSAQADRAFVRFFGSDAPSVLPDGLSIGDFATVKRKAELLGPVSSALLISWLEEELAAKGTRPARVGFVKAR